MPHCFGPASSSHVGRRAHGAVVVSTAAVDIPTRSVDMPTKAAGVPTAAVVVPAGGCCSAHTVYRRAHGDCRSAQVIHVAEHHAYH